MGKYDTQQVCLNGHQMTDLYHKYPEHRREFCSSCGASTIHKCPSCQAEIPGRYIFSEYNISTTFAQLPKYCKGCGVEFPWAQKTRQLNQLIQKITNENNRTQPVQLVDKICSRFHLVAKQLRERYNSRQTLDIEDEYDVQDLLHALLRLFFDDIRPEEWTPSYAGKSARVDFLLKNEQIIIEVKKTGKSVGRKELGDQLIIDIERYQSHPDCKILYCFVYDPEGRIANPKGIENDLCRKDEQLQVKVNIVPKGF